MNLSKLIKQYSILSCFVLILGCKSPNPNPEFLDPIYKDLVGLAKKYESESASLEKKLEEDLKAESIAGADGMDLKIARKALKETREQLKNSRQMALYYKIRSERRKYYGRLEYIEAFKNDRDWPNKSDIITYNTAQRLRNASRNWGVRVPNNSDRYSKKVNQNEESK